MYELSFAVRSDWPELRAILAQRHVDQIRSRRYTDPLTGKDDWRLVHIGPNGEFTDSVINKKEGKKEGRKAGRQEGRTEGRNEGRKEAAPAQRSRTPKDPSDRPGGIRQRTPGNRA